MPGQKTVGEDARHQQQIEILGPLTCALEEPLRHQGAEVFRKVVGRGKAALSDAAEEGTVLAAEIAGDRHHPLRHEIHYIDDLRTGHLSAP